METEGQLKSVVVFSGGQDSTTCLAIEVAKRGPDAVHAITFTYGQRHVVEVKCAERIARYFNVKHVVVDLGFMPQLVVSALTGDGDVSSAHPHNATLPASFVPNRNAVLLTLAHAYAQGIGAECVVTGVCQTDYSGYPDCREEFINALEAVLQLGSGSTVRIEAPLMHKSKAEIFTMAMHASALPAVIELSHTCYNGERGAGHRKVWGYGCGTCPACVIRARGWDEFIDTHAARAMNIG
jgi:7-cyano-7-deazaguanine synthase